MIFFLSSWCHVCQISLPQLGSSFLFISLHICYDLLNIYLNLLPCKYYILQSRFSFAGVAIVEAQAVFCWQGNRGYRCVSKSPGPTSVAQKPMQNIFPHDSSPLDWSGMERECYQCGRWVPGPGCLHCSESGLALGWGQGVYLYSNCRSFDVAYHSCDSGLLLYWALPTKPLKQSRG